MLKSNIVNMNRKHEDHKQFTTLATDIQPEEIENKTEPPLESLVGSENPTVLFIEPYYGGSHKQLIDLLAKSVLSHTFVSLKPKKWHWRARCGALMLATIVPKITTETVLFCSSVLNLTELIGLRFDLHNLKKVVYFHENQLVYPIRNIKERDVQFAYNQITTCLVADVIVFNSFFNKESFLSSIQNILKLLPDYKPKDLRCQIEPKCKVLYFPVSYQNVVTRSKSVTLHIVWPHRWEFDKNPDTFLKVLFRLKENGVEFTVSILGEIFVDVPEIFSQAKEILKDNISHFGYSEKKEDYYEVLSTSHVAVSTAIHEFFGVSMLEAASLGCYPLVPNRLVYPEIYPKHCLYNTEDELYERLKYFCLNPEDAISQRNNLDMDLSKYSADHLLPLYLKLFDE